MSPLVARLLTVLATLVVLATATAGITSADAVVTLIAVASGVAVVSGWVVVAHDPRSPVGPALAWSSACVALVQLEELLAASAYTGDPMPLADVARPLWVGSWPVNLAGLFALLLVFPGGRRRGRPWSALPWTYAAATLGVVVAEWGNREEGGQVVGASGPVRLALVSVGAVTIGVCLVLAAASVMMTYRRGDPRTREQVRWLLVAGVVVVVLLVAGWVGQALGVGLTAFAPFLVAIVVLVPLAVGVAVVRHDLFDVDRLLSESASWSVTLALSAAIYGSVVLVAGQVLAGTTGLDSAAAAFVTALALLPLHRYVATLVGRLVDRDRYVAVAAVEAFAADVRAGSREPEEVEAVLRGAQGDPDLRLLLVGPDGGWVDVAGRPATPGPGFAIESRGDTVARISLGWQSARARRRVEALARAAWVPIEVSRLRLVLRDALDEARASRARLVEATAVERRRLERDLHDGVQQRLLATGMRLRALERDLDADGAAEVDLAVAELEATVVELRRLAHGVRPSRLDDGLGAALAAVRAATPLPIDLVVEELPALDETRALTAYLVVSEAVANVLKHARATRIDVRVWAHDDGVAVDVHDDGIGGVPAEESLVALRDRILSVGGRLLVESPPDGGTTIRAML